MWLVVLQGLVFAAALAPGVRLFMQRRPRPRGRRPLAQTPEHYRRLYSRRNFLKLGVATAGAALMAYGGVDEAMDAWHSREVQRSRGFELTRVLNQFGERLWFGYFALFAVADAFCSSNRLTRWGRRSFEAMVVGLPALWTTQRVLGASRPNEGLGPGFAPFEDDNAASGHAFIGSIPLLVAARQSDAPAPRALLYALSPWVGWARIHDRKHYLSQVLLGYGIAWEAVQVVDAAAKSESDLCPPGDQSVQSGAQIEPLRET
jgi:hypothetical protein